MLLANQFILRTKLQHRTVSLVAFSLGTEVVLSCLEYLAQRGAYGIVHNVYMLGGAANVSPDDLPRWESAFRMVSGRIVNCFASTDYVLKHVYNKLITSDKAIGTKVLQFEQELRRQQREEQKEREDVQSGIRKRVRSASAELESRANSGRRMTF